MFPLWDPFGHSATERNVRKAEEKQKAPFRYHHAKPGEGLSLMLEKSTQRRHQRAEFTAFQSSELGPRRAPREIDLKKLSVEGMSHFPNVHFLCAIV